MTEDLFLGLDVGSSSTKAVLVDADGALVAEARLEHGISRPRPGWAEQDDELRDATRPLAHALGAWQLKRARETMARGTDAEGAGRLLPGGALHD